MMRPAHVSDFGVTGVYSDHRRLDARSLAMHCIVANKLLANPALMDQARNTVARWKALASQPLPFYIVEWGQILDASLDQIAGVLASMSEDATRLRQSSPFTGILMPEERAAIYETFR